MTLLYKHRQIGTLMLAALGLALVLDVWSIVRVAEDRVAGVVVLPILLACILLLYALTIEVSTDAVVVSFGPGWIRRRLALQDIRAARAVRNRWYYGWGIRVGIKGMLFNVSGLDAVELELANGSWLRIGTNDPHGLERAIHEAQRMAL